MKMEFSHDEISFKRYFRKRWKSWSESYEPGLGGGLGVPDLQVLVEGQLLPIELKVGKVLASGSVKFSLRPAQIQWHKRFLEAGGISCVCVGVKYNLSFRMFFFSGRKLMKMSAFEFDPRGCGAGFVSPIDNLFSKINMLLALWKHSEAY